jgi:hypothetical protein
MNGNNIDPHDLYLSYIYIDGVPMYNEDGDPIVVGYVGNYVDPANNQSYLVYMRTDTRQFMYIPEAPQPQQYMPLQVFEHDEAPADRMDSPRPQRLRTLQQEAARQRRITLRAIRRARRHNQDNIFLRDDNPGNIFLNPIQRMPRPSPVGPRHQLPNPASKRSLRKASRQQRDERAANVVNGRIYGGTKTRRRLY